MTSSALTTLLLLACTGADTDASDGPRKDTSVPDDDSADETGDSGPDSAPSDSTADTGTDTDGETGDDTGSTPGGRYVAVTAGSAFACAMDVDGRAGCWAPTITAPCRPSPSTRLCS